MYPTRQSGAAVGLVPALALLAVVADRPIFLGGAVLVGAWFLFTQRQFARDLERTAGSLSVDQSLADPDPRANDTVPVTLVATLERPSPLSLSLEAGLPTGATSEETLAVSLEPGQTTAERTVDVTWPVAGRHRFEEVTVRAADGRFRETLPAGDRPTVTVVPRGPRSIHVGTGGDRLPTAIGEHELKRPGSGIEPAEVREYVPGDTVRRIDWKATARLGVPHVREFEIETDRRTMVVVDHRDTLADGPTARTKLDFLRGTAIATVDAARRVGDPTALLTVGDDGITGWRSLGASASDYRTLRRRLLELEPTTPAELATTNDSEGREEPTPEGTELDAPSTRTNGSGSQPDRTAGDRPRSGRPAGDASRSLGVVGDGHRRTTAAEVNRHLVALEGANDAFAETLVPFMRARRAYRKRIESDPLYGAVRSRLARQRGFVWTAIFTDDARPAELRETVSLARSGGNEVAVFLAPTVLYEPGGLADVERAYERYLAFERLRRDLARMERVTAFEVGPGDRLATVLEAGRSRGGRS